MSALGEVARMRFGPGKRIAVRRSVSRVPAASLQGPMETPTQASLLPAQIYVHSIQNSSGIFIGNQNVMFGWSSSSKQNIGFGTLQSGSMSRNNLTMVYDADVYDALVDDRDVHYLQQISPGGAPTTTHIGFQSLHVNSMQQNAGVFVGDTNITGLDQHQKQNQASGSVFGHNNTLMGNLNVNDDRDFIDSPINDQDIKSGMFYPHFR